MGLKSSVYEGEELAWWFDWRERGVVWPWCLLLLFMRYPDYELESCDEKGDEIETAF
jgi:hypothetical protein